MTIFQQIQHPFFLQYPVANPVLRYALLQFIVESEIIIAGHAGDKIGKQDIHPVRKMFGHFVQVRG